MPRISTDMSTLAICCKSNFINSIVTFLFGPYFTTICPNAIRFATEHSRALVKFVPYHVDDRHDDNYYGGAGGGDGSRRGSGGGRGNVE